MGDELDGLLAEHESGCAVERGLAPNSLAAYRRDLRRYAEYLRRRGVTGDVGARRRGDRRRLRRRAAAGAATDDGQRRYTESSIARGARRGAVVPPVLRGGGAARRRPERGGRRAPRAPGHPQGAHRGRGRRAARRGARRRTRARYGTAPSSSCSTRAGCASASWSASTSATSTSTTAWCACWARATRNGSCRSAAPRAKPWATTSRPAVPSSIGRTTARAGAVFLERARRAAHPPGRVVDRARRRRPRRAAGPPVPARAAPLVRDPHARPRRRHPGGAGAARPRQPVDHAGVHEGVAGAAAGGLRGRASPGGAVEDASSARNRGPSGGAGSRLGRMTETSHAAAARPAPGGARPGPRAAGQRLGSRRRRRPRLRRGLRRLGPGHRRAG